MSDIEAAPLLHALDAAVLRPLVRVALSSDSAELVDWRYEPIGAFLGPVTRGVYRVGGTALQGNHELAWSVVLKVIAAPDFNTHMYGDVAHPLYWKREALAYQSGLLDDLPGGLKAPRCLAVVEQQDESIWLWIEDVKERYGERWPLEQYACAARAIGMFNGAYLVDRSIPPYPWLVTNGSPRGLINHSTHIRDIIQDPHTWEHPLVQSAFPAPMAERLLQLWADREALLDALDRIPQTLCHLDMWRGNLFAPEGQHRLIAIDWAFPGRAAVGTDAGDLFAPSFGLFKVEPTQPTMLDEAIFESYLDGLREAGWGGERHLVRFAYAAFASLKYGCVIPWLADALDESRHAIWPSLSKRPMDEFLYNQRVLLDYLLKLADEARRLVDSV